jgi:putative ABC transport system substrate-binding protein
MAIHIERRQFIFALGGAAAAWPSLAARAQQSEGTRRVGFLIGLGDDTEARARFAAFRERLAALGWSEGRNVEIVARFATADPDRNRAAVAEIIALAPDVVLALGYSTVSALQKATGSVPPPGSQFGGVR